MPRPGFEPMSVGCTDMGPLERRSTDWATAPRQETSLFGTDLDQGQHDALFLSFGP